MSTPGSVTWPRFVEREGCVLLAEGLPKQFNRANFVDATAIESFYNHIHLEDDFGLEWRRIRRSWKSRELPRVGEAIARLWAFKLHLEFPRKRFRLYLSWGDSLVLRFHTVRSKETPWCQPSADLQLSVYEVGRGVEFTMLDPTPTGESASSPRTTR